MTTEVCKSWRFIVLILGILLLAPRSADAREPAKLTLGVSEAWINTGIMGQPVVSDVDDSTVAVGLIGSLSISDHVAARLEVRSPYWERLDLTDASLDEDIATYDALLWTWRAGVTYRFLGRRTFAPSVQAGLTSP